MKITIIFLTVFYLILTIVAKLIYNYIDQMGFTLSTKEASKLYLIGNICKLISYITVIIDTIFILAFFL